MEEEITSVVEETPAGTAEESLPEIEQAVEPILGETVEPVVDTTAEEVDEMGVPIKNRLAEINRKKRKISAEEASRALIDKSLPASEDPLEIVRNIAREETAPLRVKLFLSENPEAATMIEDINRIRQQHPEIAGVENLELAYKLALVNKQEQLTAQKIEQGVKENLKKIEESKSATVEGVGKTKAPQISLSDKIASATSIKELEELAASIQQ